MYIIMLYLYYMSQCLHNYTIILIFTWQFAFKNDDILRTLIHTLSRIVLCCYTSSFDNQCVMLLLI